jgi:hypothetical protein
VNERITILFAQRETSELRPSAWAWALENFERIARRLPPPCVQVLVYTRDRLVHHGPYPITTRSRMLGLPSDCALGPTMNPDS